ncbi:MAG: hemerythrin domain-containing protein [Acidimicrobiales bacterium]
MDRINLYASVHKMQRARLFSLVVEAGRTDRKDLSAAAVLAAAVGSMVREPRAHAEHEDRFIHPLLRERAPTVAAKLDASHVALDVAMEELSRPPDPAGMDEARDLYLPLTRFTASYLDHLACEEDEAMPALWQACTEEELQGAMVSFRQSRSPVENLTSLLAQLPTLSRLEAAELLAAGLGRTPAGELTEVLATLLGPLPRGALAPAIDRLPVEHGGRPEVRVDGAGSLARGAEVPTPAPGRPPNV